MKRAWMTATLAAMVAAGCDGGSPTAAPVAEVEAILLTPSAASLVVGDTISLTARAVDADGETLEGVAVTWTSLGTAAATVVGDGVHGRVRAVGAGVARIRATGGGTSTEAVVTVSNPVPGPVTSVEISVDTLKLEEGGTLQLAATARDANGQVVTGRTVVWTSGDPDVVRIEALGTTTGIRTGDATISARVDGVTSTIPARITANYPYDLVFTGWDGTNSTSTRVYRASLADPARTAVRIGPDAPSGGGIASPDGAKLAWVTDFVAGSRSIMVANSNGTGAVEVLRTSDFSCGRITWSPDASRIAFACAIGDTDRDIWVADLAGDELHNVTEGLEGHQEWPSWSPVLPGGGSRIAFVQYQGGLPSIWTIGDDGADPTKVTAGIDDQPAWSPDGTSIAFRRIGTVFLTDVWVTNAAGGSERMIAGGVGHQDAPAWSPDGRLVAFVSNHASYGSGQPLVPRIYTVWADGSKVAQRTLPDMHAGSPAWVVR